MDLKYALINQIENNTGFVGDALKKRRLGIEQQKQTDDNIIAIEQTTDAVRATGATLSSLEVHFIQISKNVQAMAKALNAQVTLQEETDLSLSKQVVSPQIATVQQKTIKEEKNSDEESTSILDGLLGLLSKAKKVYNAKKAAAAKKAAEKERIKKAQQKAKDAALKKGASPSQADAAAKKAGEKASERIAKQTTKEVTKDVIKETAKKSLSKSLGKMAAKSIPIVGVAAGVGFAIGRLIKGDPVGAGIEAAGSVGSAVTAIPATIAQTVRDIYYETYEVYPEQDPLASKRLKDIQEAVTESAEEILKTKIKTEEPNSRSLAKPTPAATDSSSSEFQMISPEETVTPPPPPSKTRAAPPTPITKPSPPITTAQQAQQPLAPITVPSATPTPESKPASAAISKPAPAATSGLGVVYNIIGALKEAGINSMKAIANILATIKAETNFNLRSENLNYKSAEQIQKVFGKNRIPTLEFAQQFVNNPEALANHVYKTTDGNSDPGDGWKYRGRGWIQHTGKNQYAAISKFTGVDVLSNPDLLNDPIIATKALAWFFLSYKRKKPEQLEDMSQVNKAVGFADTTGEKALKRAESAEQIATQISSGKEIGTSSTQVAAAKKDLAQQGQSTTVVVVNNNTEVKKAASQQPKREYATMVG